MAITVERIDHLVLNVADVETSARWYAEVLGMRREQAANGRTILWFGTQKIHVRPHSASQEEWFTGRTTTPGGSDLCFSVTASAAEIEAHLKACSVEVELGPVERSGALGTMTSLYCRDPDGSLIEVSTYSPGIVG